MELCREVVKLGGGLIWLLGSYQVERSDGSVGELRGLSPYDKLSDLG